MRGDVVENRSSHGARPMGLRGTAANDQAREVA